MYELPYGNTQQLNLDWFIKRWKEFYEEWEQTKTEIDGALDEEVQKVEDAMEDLYAARDAAAASATAAAASAASASNDATIAANAATAAAASATLANTKATAAGLSEAAAALSASQAANDATAAATSASQASASASSATDSAQAAATSEQNIESIIEDAIQDATDAAVEEATADAEAAATAAESSASDAADSATAAAASAAAADSSADDAADSATAAAGSATAAAGSASDAADSATAAAASAASIVVDSAMSDSSTNPVQNKVINGELTQLKTALNFNTQSTDITDQLVEYTSAYITSAGVITNSTSWKAFLLFAEDAFNYDKISYSSYQVSSGRKQVAFYSSTLPSDDTYLSGIAFISGENPSVITINASDIPNGTKSILFTNLVSGGSISATGIKETNDVEEAKTSATTTESEIKNILKTELDKRFNYICYSDNGNSGGIAINTEEMYTWAGRHDFVAIKGDVRISSDGELVMCHDAGFTLDSNGHITNYNSADSIKIANMTYAECVALTYPNGEHVCGIDALIRTCKIYGKIAYVTVRDETNWWSIAPKLFESINKYDMGERTMINSFTYKTLQIMRAYDNDIPLSWVQEANHSVTTADVDKAYKLGNVVICGYDYGNGSPTGITNQSASVIAYAKEKGIRFYEAIVTNDTNLNLLYDNGIMGAQIEFLPSCFVY